MSRLKPNTARHHLSLPNITQRHTHRTHALNPRPSQTIETPTTAQCETLPLQPNFSAVASDVSAPPMLPPPTHAGKISQKSIQSFIRTYDPQHSQVWQALIYRFREHMTQVRSDQTLTSATQEVLSWARAYSDMTHAKLKESDAQRERASEIVRHASQLNLLSEYVAESLVERFAVQDMLLPRLDDKQRTLPPEQHANFIEHFYEHAVSEDTQPNLPQAVVARLAFGQHCQQIAQKKFHNRVGLPWLGNDDAWFCLPESASEDVTPIVYLPAQGSSSANPDSSQRYYLTAYERIQIEQWLNRNEPQNAEHPIRIWRELATSVLRQHEKTHQKEQALDKMSELGKVHRLQNMLYEKQRLTQIQQTSSFAPEQQQFIQNCCNSLQEEIEACHTQLTEPLNNALPNSSAFLSFHKLIERLDQEVQYANSVVLHVPESSKATRFYHAYSQTLETQAALFTEMLIPFVQKHKKYQRDYAGGMTLQERTEMDAYSESTEPRDEHQEVLNRTYQHYKQCFPRQDKLAQLWHAFCRAYAEHNPEEANLPDYVAHWVQEQMLTRSDTESLRQFIEDIPPAWWQHQISTALPPQNIAKYWAKLKIPKTQRRSNIPSETTHAAIPGWLNPETQAAIPMFSEHTHTLRKIQKAAMGRYMPPNYRRQHGEDNKLLPIGAMAEDFARFSPHLQALTQQMLNTSTARIQYASATSQNQFYDVLRTKTAQYRYVKSMHDRLAQSMQGLSTW